MMKRMMIVAVVASVLGSQAVARQVEWCVVDHFGDIRVCYSDRRMCMMQANVYVGGVCVPLQQ